MTQISSKYDFEDLENSVQEGLKTLPNSFNDTKDEVSFLKSLIISLILHPLCVFLIWLIVIGLTFLGLIIPKADRPDWKKKDLEFVIVTNEAEPINKNTKYRSDRNSRAGGKHDPNKKVSEPSPSPSPAPAAKTPAPAPAPAPVQKAQPKPAPQPVQKPVQQAPSPAPVQKPKPAPPKPSQAPVQKPVYKPATEMPKPSMPKLATAPKSPFSVAVPKTNAPVGPRPMAGSGTSTGSQASGGSSTSKGTGSYMPSPQLSPSRGSGSGSRGGSGSSSNTARGTGGYGTGNMGNPGPGNPSSPPGIDAVKSPNWGPYMRDLERRIKQNWNPPKGDASKRVVVMFKIGRDGRLLSINIKKSSGSVSNDDAAKAAIELTAPFKPLPPEFKGNSIDIEFTFDYNVLGASYR